MTNKIFSPDFIKVPSNFWGFALVWGRMGIAAEKVAYMNTRKSADVLGSFFKNPPRMMPMKVGSYIYGVGVMKNNFIYKVTEDVMSDLVEGGIPQHFLSYIRKVILKPKLTDDKEPKRFGVDDLMFGFMIFLESCAVSIFVFVIELLVFYSQEFVALKSLLKALKKLQ